ncbi:DUF1479-domain-containing protein, partial [Coprinellus micaceus]
CIPQVKFQDLETLDAETDDEEAAKWKDDLKQFAKDNPRSTSTFSTRFPGFPAHDKQFFELYWTKPQVKARSHPNLIAASKFLNQLYHLKSGSSSSQLEGVDLSVPLTYADRFRIRKPGQAGASIPHTSMLECGVGGTIERWEEPEFRKCFEDILEGKWKEHDPYDLAGRFGARTSLYGRPSQSTVFRTFQGWLAMSETAPGEDPSSVPDTAASSSDALNDPKNWEFGTQIIWTIDVTDPLFHGIRPRDGGYQGPMPTPELHPHLQLEKTMISIPKVYPGDAVFWHCDVVHAVEHDHNGTGDSAVMYIPAVPKTPMNLAYVARQKECFLQGERPPDFPKGKGEKGWVGCTSEEDIFPPLEELRSVSLEVVLVLWTVVGAYRIPSFRDARQCT